MDVGHLVQLEWLVVVGEPDIEAVVSAAADGSEEAWAGIVDRYTPLVMSVIRRHRLYADDSQDVYQTVWLRLVERLDSLREPRALPAWLMTTTKNECLRVLRTADRSTPLDPEVLARSAPSADCPEPDEGLLRHERHQALLGAFAELPDHQRELLLMLLADPPPTYAQIAERLGISVGYIGPTRARALARLRRSAEILALGDQPGADEKRGGRHDDSAVAGR